MSKKFGLIANLEEEEKSPKQKFQLFEVEMGFERAEVKIPYNMVESFEEECMKVQPKGKATLSRIAKKYEGTVK